MHLQYEVSQINHAFTKLYDSQSIAREISENYQSCYNPESARTQQTYEMGYDDN